MTAFGPQLRERLLGRLKRRDLAIDAGLAHAARDQLRDLRAEIDDQHFVVVADNRFVEHILRHAASLVRQKTRLGDRSFERKKRGAAEAAQKSAPRATTVGLGALPPDDAKPVSNSNDEVAEEVAPSIVWFREDLRLADNEALAAACAAGRPFFASIFLMRKAKGFARTAAHRAGGCITRSPRLRAKSRRRAAGSTFFVDARRDNRRRRWRRPLALARFSGRAVTAEPRSPSTPP